MDVHPTKNVSIGIDPYPYYGIFCYPEISTEYPFGISILDGFDRHFLHLEPDSCPRDRLQMQAQIWRPFMRENGNSPRSRSLFFAFRSGSHMEDFLEDLMVELVEPRPFAGISMDLSFEFQLPSLGDLFQHPMIRGTSVNLGMLVYFASFKHGTCPWQIGAPSNNPRTRIRTWCRLKLCIHWDQQLPVASTLIQWSLVIQFYAILNFELYKLYSIFSRTRWTSAKDQCFLDLSGCLDSDIRPGQPGPLGPQIVEEAFLLQKQWMAVQVFVKTSWSFLRTWTSEHRHVDQSGGSKNFHRPKRWRWDDISHRAVFVEAHPCPRTPRTATLTYPSLHLPSVGKFRWLWGDEPGKVPGGGVTDYGWES